MFAFLKAPPDAAPISDKRELDERYRYWRRHILLTIWLGYALFYFTRKSFNAAVPEILASNVLTRSDIGLLATLFYITYGLSKFFSGIVSDRSDAQRREVLFVHQLVGTGRRNTEYLCDHCRIKEQRQVVIVFVG